VFVGVLDALFKLDNKKGSSVRSVDRPLEGTEIVRVPCHCASVVPGGIIQHLVRYRLRACNCYREVHMGRSRSLWHAFSICILSRPLYRDEERSLPIAKFGKLETAVPENDSTSGSLFAIAAAVSVIITSLGTIAIATSIGDRR
jgi:hypothetical protein